MSRTLNFVVFEGEILKEVSYSVTDRGDDCASFIVCLDRNGRTWNKIRVNAFSESVRACKEAQLEPGKRVIVVGEIMTRFGMSKVHSNEIRMFRVFVTQGDTAQVVRQSIANMLSLEEQDQLAELKSEN